MARGERMDILRLDHVYGNYNLLPLLALTLGLWQQSMTVAPHNCAYKASSFDIYAFHPAYHDFQGWYGGLCQYLCQCRPERQHRLASWPSSRWTRTTLLPAMGPSRCVLSSYIAQSLKYGRLCTTLQSKAPRVLFVHWSRCLSADIM